MRIDVDRAQTELSNLISRAEAGEEIEIARDGTPVAKLVPLAQVSDPGPRFLAAEGSLAGQITLGEDFEFTAEELDEILDEPA